MEENTRTKSININGALCELNTLQRIDDNMAGPSTSTITSHSLMYPAAKTYTSCNDVLLPRANFLQQGTSDGATAGGSSKVNYTNADTVNGGCVIVRGFRSIPPPTMTTATDGIAFYGNVTKLQMNLNPRYISKITNSPRKITDTSLRMRPYFIPERSRTKSENNVDHMPHTTVDFFSTTNNNSNSSMMETCDGYTINDAVQSTIPGATGTNATMMTPNFMGAFNCHSGISHSAGSGGNATCNGFNGMLAHPNVSGMRSAGGSAGNSVRSSNSSTFLKKSRSLEDVRVENLDGSQPSHEMEFVSSRIQKLKVQE